MTRHLIDKSHSADSTRAARFASLERQSGDDTQHPKLGILRRRQGGRAVRSKLRQFLRIERGLRA